MQTLTSAFTVDKPGTNANIMKLVKVFAYLTLLKLRLSKSNKNRDKMITVFGNDTKLQMLLDNNPEQWPSYIRFITKLAYVKDDNKHYWLARRSDGLFVTISCNHFLEFVGWGTIRKDEHGFMQIAQSIPEQIETSLRKQTAETLKQQAVSGLSCRRSS